MKPQTEGALWVVAGAVVWTLGGLYSFLAFIGLQGVGGGSMLGNYLVLHGLIAIGWLGLGGAFFYIGRRVSR